MNQGAIDFNTHNHVPHTPTNVLVFLIEILRVTLIALAAVVPTKVLVYLNNATGTTSRPMTTTTQLFRHVGITRALKTAIRNLRNREDQTQRDFFYGESFHCEYLVLDNTFTSQHSLHIQFFSSLHNYRARE